jgi:hypothetical protein
LRRRDLNPNVGRFGQSSNCAGARGAFRKGTVDETSSAAAAENSYVA